jgi:divalent metal cation (Fe/Co/Zn/Cd) transporter
MDESDTKLLAQLVEKVNANRNENWIDLHKLRIIKFGSILHVDCHLTVPWYLTVREGHAEVDRFSEFVKKEFGESVELFVHSDGCENFSCSICLKHDCQVRQHDFVKRLNWTIEMVSDDSKHSLKT